MGQCCSCVAENRAVVREAHVTQGNKEEGVGATRVTAVAASADTPVAARSPSVVSLTPSGTEKRHRSVAASPTRFFELLAEPSAKVRTELLMKASIEYQASGDMGPLQPDTPQNSVRSLLNALLLKQAPNQDAMLLQDMCGDAWIHRSCLTNWRPLGEGAFATVQHCMLKQDAGTLVPVAVKKLKPHVINNAIDLREFLAEANTLRRLKHRHIVEFKGVGCMEPHTPESMTSSLFIVQEFMSGDTLKVHVLHQMFPSNTSPVAATYTWQDAFRWLHQIAAALTYLHSLRPMVVHRDLKLENLLLTGLHPAAADAKLADFGLCKLVKDTAGAVPFVPGTPGTTGSPVGQGPPAGPLPQGPLPNLRSTPNDLGPSPAAPVLGPDQGEAQGGTAGQGVGSPSGASCPLHPRRGDDSAKAGPSQAGNPEASSSGRSSLQTVSQTDPSNHLSMAVLVNSAASSRHHTTGDSGPTSRLGQLSRAATSETEGVETGRLLLNAPNGAGAGRFQSVPNRAGQAAIGPNDLAAVSHADGGNRSHSIVSGQGPLKPHAVEMDTHMGMDTTACSNHDGDNADAHQRAAQTSPLQLPSVDPAAHAADSAVSVETLANSQEEHTCHGSELQYSQHSLSGSAIMAQLPRFAKADSGKSASEIILSPLSSAGRHSETVSRAESDAARVSGHPDAALGQQAQPEGSSLQVPLAVGSAPQGMPEDVPQRAIELPLASEQTGAGPGAGPAEAQGQPQAALGTALSMSQAEQRNVEEQEVLYNMTGQTGSLMYMAPEVLKGQSYNEKVDVFSFAIIIFELLSSRVAMAAIANRGDQLDYEAVRAHAEETANGYRLAIPVEWPAPVRSLIEDCWAQRSSKRPSFATIERRLEDIRASGVIEEYLVGHPKDVLKPALQSGCTIS